MIINEELWQKPGSTQVPFLIWEGRMRYRLNEKFGLHFSLVNSIPPSLIWAEIKCMVHVALLKRPINQLKPVHQRRQQAVRDYCHYIYCATKLTYELPSHDWPKKEVYLES